MTAPSQHKGLETGAYDAWIGRTENSEDIITPELVRRFCATLDLPLPHPLQAGQAVPPGLHWCLSPTVLPARDLGADGHPARGGFLPPIPLQRRMWAGGTVASLDPLRIGDVVQRRSTITRLAPKQGRSGPLCFVTVEHELLTPRGPALTEQHDIVYREPASPAAGPGPKDGRQGAHQARHPTDATLLFRYSALTFNGHRIHYDELYARSIESYPGLVVHGPLQATWLLNLAAGARGHPPARFAFRATQTMYCNEVAFVNASETALGLEMWVAKDDGTVTMTATAEW